MSLPGRGLLLGLLRHLAGASVKEEELAALVTGFWGFFAILAGYFLLLPFRDEAGVSLGTHNLPKLFAASLVLTLLATPMASFFLNRHHNRARGLRQLYMFLSLVVLVFCAAYMAAGGPAQQQKPGHRASSESASRTFGQEHGPGLEGSSQLGQERQQGMQSGGQQQEQQEGRRRLAEQQQETVSEHAAAAGGHAAEGERTEHSANQPLLTPAQLVLRVLFFLMVSLMNLVAVSTWWARAADVFSAEAAARLFGILGAGATLGQLVGSLAAATLSQAPVLRASPTSPSILPLLLSAAMLALAGQRAERFHAAGPPARARSFDTAEKGVWPEEGTSPNWALHHGAQHSSSGGGGSRNGSNRSGQLGRAPWTQTLASTAEGFQLIRHSSYLRHLCAFLVLNYFVSSFFYFEKTLVAATAVKDAASRTAWFATINSASAFCILALQLVATGPLLRFLGTSRALAVTPTAAGLLMALVALSPTPNLVSLAEVLRKVLTYSLARPAREVLFTVVTREEKYKAKIFIDTVVQRCGDVVAAGAFQALDGFLDAGPSGVAAAAVPLCCLWVWVALALGRRQERLAAGARRKLEGEGSMTY